MKRESISGMIDRKIMTFLGEGKEISFIIDDLWTRMNKFIQNIKDSDKTVDVYKLLIREDVESIGPTKLRYQIIYIKESMKRVEELNWLKANKSRFDHLSKVQSYKLLKLKEKLSEENALPF